MKYENETRDILFSVYTDEQPWVVRHLFCSPLAYSVKIYSKIIGFLFDLFFFNSFVRFCLFVLTLSIICATINKKGIKTKTRRNCIYCICISFFIILLFLVCLLSIYNPRKQWQGPDMTWLCCCRWIYWWCVSVLHIYVCGLTSVGRVKGLFRRRHCSIISLVRSYAQWYVGLFIYLLAFLFRF